MLPNQTSFLTGVGICIIVVLYFEGKLSPSILPPVNTPPKFSQDVKSIFERPNLVLQLVSNCRTSSRRENYVKQLKRYIRITQLGKCFGGKCSPECETRAISKHKFYLSFENSVCQDYISEKMFRRLGHMLPVVLKRSIYSGFIPDDAFIAADDFKCPEDLAKYLRYLGGNYTAFSKYFEWTKHWKLERENHACLLCKFLNEKNGTVKTLANFREWWYDDKKCEKYYADRLTCH
ncbi:unnamed protein product [Enterobius vermicularis]|uniref:Fucosyltransferase n=1 Tax=Enterobius vermicularis TaxID=51028 RepID=A0A0N4VNF7_ENTVE|nr:unnamed protein product [Enterobius vermicularis]